MPSAESREFDMASYQQRYVALEIFYLGWDYHGFASQADTEHTIEVIIFVTALSAAHQDGSMPREHWGVLQGRLFAALRQTRLIPEGVGWEGLGYSRCGRTDKGVSALGQVCACRSINV